MALRPTVTLQKNWQVSVGKWGKICLLPNIRYPIGMGNPLHSFHRGGEKQYRKRVFPRYPFSFLVFKAQERAFEVRDISFRGMQISLKDGEHGLSPGDCLNGELHWKGEVLSLDIQIKWAEKDTVGGAFERDGDFDKKIQSFFCVENILKELRPLHLQEAERELPKNLKYWFKSDGSVEFFVWCRGNGQISSFQGIVLDKFLEWEEGREVWTGRILKHRDLETPLDYWEEFFFEEDSMPNSFVVDFAHKIFSGLSKEHVSDEDRKFLLFHLR